MDLFTLAGKIAIDCTEAETKIDGLLTKVGQLSNAINGTGSGTGGGTGSGTGGSSGGTGSGTTTTSSGTSTSTSTFSSDTSSFLKSVFSVSIGNLSATAIRSLVDAIKSAVKDGYQYNLDKESYVASLKTMMGVTWEEANAFFDRLTKISVNSPLNMTSLGEAATRFLALGYDADSIVEKMLVLGDISRGNNDTFVRIAKAFSDVYGKSGLKAQEKNQFAEAGVPIFSLLADLYSVPYTTQEEKDAFNELMITKMERKGMVSPDDVWNALKESTEEGGLFYRGMNTAMQTTKGQMERAEESKGVFWGTLLDKTGAMDFSKNINSMKAEAYQTATDVISGDYTPPEKTLWEKIFSYFDQKEAMTSESNGTKSFTTPTSLHDATMQLWFGVGRPEEQPWGAGPPTPEGWVPPNLSNEGLENLSSSISTAVQEGINAALPGAVESGMSKVTITPGNVTLHDGVLVGHILHRINVGLGQYGTLAERGNA